MTETNIIAIRKTDIIEANNAFGELMNKTVSSMNQAAEENPSDFRIMTSSELEKSSYNYIRNACSGTPFDPTQIILVSGQKFPDIIAAGYYGVEVKSTNKNHWTSTGSSIVESTRDNLVESIYMLFGKLGGNPPEFKCRPYQDVLYDIAVTHSPRYLINMETEETQTIFAKMQTDYDTFRKSTDSIEQVRRYYKNKAKKENKQEMPWWLTSSESERTSGFNIRLWSSVAPCEQKELITLAMILFPEALSPISSRRKYSNLSLWLCSYRQIINPNIRDIFSAGGNIKSVDGQSLEQNVPKIFATIVKYAQEVKKLLEKPTIEVLDLIKEYNPKLLETKELSLYDKWINSCQAIAELTDKNINLKEWTENPHILKC